MANLLEDIQCAGSDTRPPMLDMTDFDSWQQRIRLYYRGKESRVNILKSIDEGPYQMGTVRETLAESTERTPQLGPKRPRVYSGLTPKEKDRLQLNSKFMNNMLPEWEHETHAKENKMMLERFSQPTVDPLALMSNVSNPQHYSPSSSASSSTQVPQPLADSSLSSPKNLIENLTNMLALLTQSYKTCLPQTNNQLRTSSNARNQATVQDGRLAQENGVALDEEKLLFLAGGQDNAFDDDMDEQPVQDLALNVDNVFQADDCDAFDSDMDEAPTAQTMFMANLSSTDLVSDEAGPSYDLDILSEPALYNGHEIIKDNHTLAIVHNTKDTLEIAKITRKKMNDKMNDPKCVTRKVKIAPHDYTKENLLATFTPQKQLTPNKSFDRKHDAIEWKNLLIANDNLIAECLSQEVFSVAINSKLNVARFTKMHVANTTVEARCLALEAKLANLSDKSHHDNQEELINHFSKLEVNHLNLQLKYQNLKDSIGNNPPTPDKDTSDFDFVFIIGKMQASLQGKDNVIRQLKKQLSQLQVTRSDTDRTLRVRTTDFQITMLTDQVTNLQAQNDLFRAENDKIKQNYKELYDSIKITRAKHIEQVTKLTTENVNLKTSVSKDKVKPQVLAREKHAINVELIVPRLRNNRDAHLDYLRHLKESVETIHDIVEEAKVVVQIAHWYLDSGRSKHMMGDRSRLINFVKKFIGTVRFGNDHFGAIMGYGDYVIGNSVNSREYYVEGLGHNLFSVEQFFNSDLEVAFQKYSCYVRDTDGVELIKGSRGSNLHTISVEDKTVPRTPQQNGVVERWNRTLVEAARTMLIISKAIRFLWAEVVATACYTQNRSLIHTRHHKTPYELVYNKKPDLTFFSDFGALCYPTNDSEDLGKLQPTTDIGIFIGYAPSSKGYRIYNKRTRRIMEMIHVQFDELTEQMAFMHLGTGPAPNLLTLGQISSGLIPNLVPATPYTPPTNKELEILFQPMFDKYLEPPRVERPVLPAQAVQAPVNSVGT
nr:hypothetical protein [Tanacetum cinerariifolium]